MKAEIYFSKEHAEFLTVTCLEWKLILAEDRFKDIIIHSLTYLVKSRRIYVYGFVIMSNHFHLIWQMIGENKRSDVQRDFLKYTCQQILKTLQKEQSETMSALLVNAKDRKHQVWERNSLGVPLWTSEVFWQKLDYVHNNPVKAGLCKVPADYKYSSARFYEKNDKDWVFLTHHEG
ncbi:MAG: transposase [Cyclobacteriaceae bacterium]|nr:transposase [Cyclobacteriaceae bacterium]